MRLRFPAEISTHSRAKAAGWCDHVCVYACEFQLTAARRRLGFYIIGARRTANFNSQPREGGWNLALSRPLLLGYFNSQPREGGWTLPPNKPLRCRPFQLTAARRRLEAKPEAVITAAPFQLTAARRRLDRLALAVVPRQPFQLTAARRRLGAKKIAEALGRNDFNSQPREGGWAHVEAALQGQSISTHSRAKAAGCGLR